MFGVGYVYKQKPGKNNKKICWRWETYNADALSVIDKVKEYLVTKKDEAEVALSYKPLMGRFYSQGTRNTPLEILSGREAIYLKLREMKNYEYCA